VFWQEPDLDLSRHDPADFALLIEVVPPDATIEYFKLGVSGAYERTGEAVLSDLEKAG
jgi:hypothetical protein